jgi:hypothetical protein
MIAKHILRTVHSMGLMAGISIIWAANINGQSIHPPNGTPLPDPPQIGTSFELKAINDSATGKGAFVFEGHEVPPVIPIPRPSRTLRQSRIQGTTKSHPRSVGG